MYQLYASKVGKIEEWVCFKNVMKMKNIEIYVEFKELVSVWPFKHLSKYSYSYFKHFMYFPEVPNIHGRSDGCMFGSKRSVILARGKEFSMALKTRPLRHNDRLSSKEQKRRNGTIYMPCFTVHKQLYQTWSSKFILTFNSRSIDGVWWISICTSSILSFLKTPP